MIINDFLLQNGILIKDNPAISPDLTLDRARLFAEADAEQSLLRTVVDQKTAEGCSPKLEKLLLWPRSMFYLGGAALFVIESKATGDCALFTTFGAPLGFGGVKTIAGALQVIPLSWPNLITLKNLVLEHDPKSTIFPRAEEPLGKFSLGIGARFTTLHWPAVAWVMKELGLPLTANQNSIPRELVYDVDAMIGNRLAEVPFPFIGRSVPEGHQGQSVQGMSHASIIEMLKHGFHRHRIPWGFNADHQPIGGRFDAIEEHLVEGSIFASYITYDISPELAGQVYIHDAGELERKFKENVDPPLFSALVRKLNSLHFAFPEQEIKRIVTYLLPALKKTKARDERYIAIRRRYFTTKEGRKLFKELSIDELPGETSPLTFAVCLALVEVIGMRFEFIAPNIGFQKNIPYSDNVALTRKLEALHRVAERFGSSIGFHSGSGKSAENYGTIGRVTGGAFEIKTSGRYTYEMGVALSRSTDKHDRALWHDWYDFTKTLAIIGAFADNATQKAFARDFIVATLEKEGISPHKAFDSPENLRRLLTALTPSPDHVFWFEYNFLFILAASGNTDRLGDHSVDGYRQRSRFYRISDQARMLYAQRTAAYILFLAESTGLAKLERIRTAAEKLAGFSSYRELLDDISKVVA
jgi:hypothetical protein